MLVLEYDKLNVDSWFSLKLNRKPLSKNSTTILSWLNYHINHQAGTVLFGHMIT